jgi:hypothetical protein
MKPENNYLLLISIQTVLTVVTLILLLQNRISHDVGFICIFVNSMCGLYNVTKYNQICDKQKVK